MTDCIYYSCCEYHKKIEDKLLDGVAKKLNSRNDDMDETNELDNADEPNEKMFTCKLRQKKKIK